VFVLGQAIAETEPLNDEIMNNFDILQSNFSDTYRNLSIKAVAGLKWVTEHCRSAKYVLKTDDDTFVNVYLLLQLLTMEKYENNALVCNVCNTAVNREGKWKTTLSECSIPVYPPFCQGVAFLMTMDVARALYNASYYVPLLWMDDVYITGFLKSLLPVGTVNHINTKTFYMSTWHVDITTTHKVLSGPDAFKFIYHHVDDTRLVESAWRELSNVVRQPIFSKYSETMLREDGQAERERLKSGVTSTTSFMNTTVF